MLGHIAATVGGLVKDVQVGLSNVGEWIVEEVSSIPDAFSAGYDHGIMSAPTELDEAEQFHVDTITETTVDTHTVTIAEQHGGNKFSSRAA